MIEIQYASDLHIDVFPNNTSFPTFLQPLSPILVLAGDIASAWNPIYKDFLEWCSNQWEHVIVITGNHEYYCNDGLIHTLEQTDNHIRDICNKLNNVIFLQGGQSYMYKTIRFVGATLWSDIDPSIWENISTKGDFAMTYVTSQNRVRKTQPSDICALHSLHRSNIASALVSHIPNEKIIVITHHMPSMELLQTQYRTHPRKTCYASSDEDLFVPSIMGWICGHGHRATIQKLPKGPVLFMNARGYNIDRDLQRDVDVYDPVAHFFLNV